MNVASHTFDEELAVEDGQDEPQGSRARRRQKERASELDQRIRDLADRVGRRPGHVHEVVVKRVDPATLRPVDNPDCARCGITFEPGEERFRDHTVGHRNVHMTGSCARARARTATTGEQRPRAQRVPAAVSWLRAHGPADAAAVADALGNQRGGMTSYLATLANRGVVVRAGTLNRPGRGRPRVLWAAAPESSA